MGGANMIPAKEIDGELWIKASDHHRAIAELESQEPIYQYQLASGAWIDQTKEIHDYNVRHGQATVRVLYTHPLQRKCENCGEFGKCCMEAESQEPVAWNSGVPPLYPQIKDGETISVEYLETTPQPQRTWVGLTDEEIIDVIHPLVMADMPDQATDYEIAKAIEAKLKEKNNA